MKKTLRLIMPQWQGGNNISYLFGAKLLSYLAPKGKNSIEVEVPIDKTYETNLPKENNVVAQSILLNQLEAAKDIIERHKPDHIITLGGDCLVSQAPFSYLNELYDGKLGVLWLDAHPDVSTPSMHNHEHAMVLGNLLGKGDPEFSSKVRKKLNPELIMYGGLQDMSVKEAEIVNNMNLKSINSTELSKTSENLLKWIKNQNIKHLAIHLDLDVLEPNSFRSLLFSQPDGVIIDAPSGTMKLKDILRVLKDVSLETEIVGLSITEYLPWDAINLHNFLEEIEIFKE